MGEILKKTSNEKFLFCLVEHIKSTKLSSSSLPTSLTQSDLEQSFTEFGYFEPG